MSSLSKEIRGRWYKHLVAYRNVFTTWRKQLKHPFNFDPKSADFLLNQNNYMQYDLKLKVNKKNFKTLCDFLAKIDDAKMLRINWIDLGNLCQYPDPNDINEFYKLLRSKSVDHRWVKILATDGPTNRDTKTFNPKVEWVSDYEGFARCANFKEIGRLFLFDAWRWYTSFLKDMDVKVNQIEFLYSFHFKSEWSGTRLSYFSKTLLTSVRHISIFWLDRNYWWSFNIQKLFRMKTIFPNLEKLVVHWYLTELDGFQYWTSMLKFKIYLVQTWDSFEQLYWFKNPRIFWKEFEKLVGLTAQWVVVRDAYEITEPYNERFMLVKLKNWVVFEDLQVLNPDEFLDSRDEIDHHLHMCKATSDMIVLDRQQCFPWKDVGLLQKTYKFMWDQKDRFMEYDGRFSYAYCYNLYHWSSKS